MRTENPSRKRGLMLAILAWLALVPPASGQLSTFSFNYDGRILVPVQVNGQAPVDVILDSGLGSGLLLLLHRESGHDLGLEYARTLEGAVRGGGTGKNKDMHLTAGDDLTLPDLDLGSLPVGVVDESRSSSALHNAGVIGAALLIPYTVEIDFETSSITIHDPEGFQAPEGWQELELDFGKNLPILETTLSIDGTREIPVRLIVDTGGKGELLLAEKEDRGLVAPDGAVYTLSGTGFRGDVFGDHARLAELKVGASVLEGIVASFGLEDEAPILDEINVDGVIGIEALNRFNLIFDYSGRRMLVQPNQFFADPFERNMAGMFLAKDPAGNTLVYHLDEGSEAEGRGLKKGDIVESVNGQPVDAYGYRELRRIFEADGSEVEMTVTREGKSRTVLLSLKRIV